MGPINRLSLGLLDFFGLKTTGQYPGTVVDAISPTFDIGDLSRVANSERIRGEPLAIVGVSVIALLVNWNGTTNPMAIGSSPDGSLKQNEAWWITRWQLRAEAALAGAIIPAAVPFVFIPGFTSHLPLQSDFVANIPMAGYTTVAGNESVLVSYGTRPLLIRNPGAIWVRTIGQADGTVSNISYRFDAEIMRVEL